MKNIVLIIVFCLGAFGLKAQFKSQGSIEFTRTENKRLGFQLEASDETKKASYYSEILKNLSTKSMSFFKMNFNKDQTVYYFDKDEKKENNMWGGKSAAENTVVQDLKNDKLTASKSMFDNTYLIEDSLQHFQWKIYDEVRDIAGYSCRKATTVICDSVVVIAFYTDQIMVSSGPESFGGLPGMILGLAIPRLYTSWFATAVTDQQQTTDADQKMLKGKPRKSTIDNLVKNLSESTKDWGPWGNPILWKARL